jgi:DNA-binding response OmpR family regulator
MRVLIVEDSEELSSLLRKALAGVNVEADITATASAASAALAAVRYTGVVLDRGLPDGDGLSVLRELRHRGDRTPVLVLTARGTVQHRVDGLNDGADDYLAKPFGFDELVARVQALLRRPSETLGRMLQLGNVKLDTEARQVFIDDEPQVFSAREVDVLELLMRRSGRVVSKSFVENHLFGVATEIGTNAVEIYVHRLRKQLSDLSAAVAIHTVRGVGYIANEIAA